MGGSFEEGSGFQNWRGWYGKVRFSVDDWLGVSSLSSLYPWLFRVASNWLVSVKHCYLGEGGSVAWDVSFGSFMVIVEWSC